MKKNILILLLLSLINISSAQAVPPAINPLQNLKDAVLSGDCTLVTQIFESTRFERISEIEAKYFNNESLAYLAYKQADVPMVDTLLSHGALSSCIKWHTASSEECTTEHKEAYQRYFMRPMPPIIKFSSLYPLLLIAMRQNKSEFFDTLLKHVDVNEVTIMPKNQDDLLPDEIERISLGIREPVLHEAIQLVENNFKNQGIKDFSIIKKLLKAGASISAKNCDDKVPLQMIVKLDSDISFPIAQLIIDHAQKNNISSDNYGIIAAIACTIAERFKNPERNQELSDLLKLFRLD